MTLPPQAPTLACNWQETAHICPSIPPQHLLGCVGYGLVPHHNHVDMAIALQPAVAESSYWQAAWYSNQANNQTHYKNMVLRYNQDVLWGCLQVPIHRQNDCGSSIYTAYSDIFKALHDLQFAYLWRVWNFIPHITDISATGVETYHAFNQGRAQAYADAQAQHILPPKALQLMPAATAVSCLGEAVQIYFIAARQAGSIIDNPLQVAPIRYPSIYGTYAPRFARARLTTCSNSTPMLCISGTAGITGHRSMCPQDIIGQCRVMWGNINAVLQQAQRSPQHLHGITVYIRHTYHAAAVQNYLHQLLPDNTAVAYFIADICRKDLLVEMEAVA